MLYSQSCYSAVPVCVHSCSHVFIILGLNIWLKAHPLNCSLFGWVCFVPKAWTMTQGWHSRYAQGAALLHCDPEGQILLTLCKYQDLFTPQIQHFLMWDPCYVSVGTANHGGDMMRCDSFISKSPRPLCTALFPDSIICSGWEWSREGD